MMPEEMDPADALTLVLKERERAKKAVYNIAMAKERIEQERDELAATYARTKIALDTALSEKTVAITEIGTLKDKGVARSQIIDELTERADAAEKRVTILETILGRIEDELHEAILEEDEFVPLEEVVARKVPDLSERHDKILYGAAAVPLESSTTRPGPAKRDDGCGERLWPLPSESGMAYDRMKRREARKLDRDMRVDIVKALIFSKSMALATLIAAPFIAMSVFNALATQGIYVDFVRALWEQTTWLSDSFKNALVAWSPVVAVQPFLVLFLFQWAFPWVSHATTKSEPPGTAEREGGERAMSPTQTPGSVIVPSAAVNPAALEPEADKGAYEKVLGELFGEDDADA